MEDVLPHSIVKDATAQWFLGLPVALTSHIMKTLERLVLDQLKPMVRLHLDLQPRTGVEDAIIYLLNRVYANLDKPGSTVRVTFFDFFEPVLSIPLGLLYWVTS